MADKKKNWNDFSWKEEKPQDSSKSRIFSPAERDFGYDVMDEILNNRCETFSEMLIRLIDEKENENPYLRDADIYKMANVSSSHFYKIRNDKDYSPSKGTVFAFALALKLSIKQTKKLLLSAGYGLSKSVKEDLIVRYFIKQKKYSVSEVESALEFFNLKSLR